MLDWKMSVRSERAKYFGSAFKVLRLDKLGLSIERDTAGFSLGSFETRRGRKGNLETCVRNNPDMEKCLKTVSYQQNS